MCKLKNLEDTSLYNTLISLYYSGLYLRNLICPKKTYSQHMEDLVTSKLLKKVNRFIDIGANNGITVSNTFLFAIKGAQGLCFEPVKYNYSRLKALFRFNSKVRCIDEGVSDKNTTYKIKSENTLSHIKETADKNHNKLLAQYYNPRSKEEIIRVRTLNEFLELYSEFSSVDLVSIDVEGHEYNVLQGINFNKFRTKCFIIETHATSDDFIWTHQHYLEINSLLNQSGYKAILKSPLNTFWIHEDYYKTHSAEIQEITNEFKQYQNMLQ